MEISKLSDKEILDFLMISDFEGDWSPMELKFLLVKWRYFYRSIHGIADRDKVYLEGEITKLNEQCDYSAILRKNLENEILDREDTINLIKKRKLTFKERWNGKIIMK